jgi:hypothetical protein
VLADGADAGIQEDPVASFACGEALSRRNDAPEAASRPFEANRDGHVLSEAAGVPVLEEFRHAKARKARTYGEVRWHMRCFTRLEAANGLVRNLRDCTALAPGQLAASGRRRQHSGAGWCTWQAVIVHGRCDHVVSEALARSALLGTCDFFLPPGEMVRLLRHVLRQTNRPRVSVNRPQVGGEMLVHSVEWKGLVFKSASTRPFVFV